MSLFGGTSVLLYGEQVFRSNAFSRVYRVLRQVRVLVSFLGREYFGFFWGLFCVEGRFRQEDGYSRVS